MPWVNRPESPRGLKDRENLADWSRASRAPAALQAALVCCACSPRASACGLSPGWVLPARWAGFVRGSQVDRTPLGGEAVKEPACRDQLVTKGSLGGTLPMGKSTSRRPCRRATSSGRISAGPPSESSTCLYDSVHIIDANATGQYDSSELY